MRRLLAGVIAVCVSLLLAGVRLTYLAPSAGATTSVVYSYSPTSGPTGTVINFTASGCPSGGIFELEVNPANPSGEQWGTSFGATANGPVQGSLKVPTTYNLVLGKTYNVFAQCYSNNGFDPSYSPCGFKVTSSGTAGTCADFTGTSTPPTTYQQGSTGASTTTVTISLTSVASKTTVPAGRAFNIHGRTLAAKKGVNGLTVTLYKRASAKQSWTKVISVKTKTLGTTTGAYRFALKGLKHSELYQVRHRKQTIGTKVYTSATGRTITIKP